MGGVYGKTISSLSKKQRNRKIEGTFIPQNEVVLMKEFLGVTKEISVNALARSPLFLEFVANFKVRVVKRS